MTALTKYQRLESAGLWRENADAQRRDVVVNLGDSSLVLTDPRSEMPLGHWSLPAVVRLNPGTRPALYAPGADGPETLEIDDPDMIAALDTVHRAIEAARPRPGRLRGAVIGAGVLSLVALAVFWMPGALIQHTARVLPPATRAQVGQIALADLVRVTGQPCSSPRGQDALTRLAQRVFPGQEPPAALVVRQGVPAALHLPGRQVVLNESLLASQDGPEVAAGYLIAERMRAESADPMIPLLTHAGLIATFRLLTTGRLSEDAVQGYAEVLIAAAPVPLADDPLLTRFAQAGLASTPYAWAVDPTGETVLPLIEGDPLRGLVAEPLLTDESWISLQDICTS
jgi:hypothetical protein